MLHPGDHMKATIETYADLREVFDRALERATDGKGAERHANGAMLDDQPFVAFAKSLPGISAHTYQIMKKAHEAAHLYERHAKESAVKELLDVMTYAAACVLVIEGQ